MSGEISDQNFMGLGSYADNISERVEHKRDMMEEGEENTEENI